MMGSPRRELLVTGEHPQKRINIKAFFLDKYPVTNSDFKVFKSEKAHYLTDAETEGYSWVLRKDMSLRAVEDQRLSHPDGEHWVAVKNASWSQPYGLGSNLEGMDFHPVVHMSYYDAYAFCHWAGKKIVSEYEWEYAARGGVEDNIYPWGNLAELHKANLWQGRFADFDFGKDGHEGLSPVTAYDPQNQFGMHDMIGNVWEWTSTIFTVPRVERDRKNPQYSVRGGSFIDTYDGRYNEEIRLTLRKGLLPSYRAENLGFRCSYLMNLKDPNAKLYRPRPPRRHRYEDTWEFKSKNAVKAMVGGVHKTQEL